MTPIDLRSDCARCAALCCVALAFDKSPLFGFDKAAGEPCRHLGAGGGCGIHASRQEQGFGGCISYECLGAGQRVTQDLFDGRDWRADRTLLEPMTEAFSRLRRLHGLLQLLDQAGRLPLSPPHRARLEALQDAAGQGDLPVDAVLALEGEVKTFLPQLRAYVVAGARPGG